MHLNGWSGIATEACKVVESMCGAVNTLRPRQNGRHFADDIFKCIFLNKNVWFPMKISLEFVPKVPINNIPSLIQIMAWRRPGAKPLSEPVMVSLLTHICIARPQWVNSASNWGWDKMATFFRCTFQIHFLERKCLNFEYNLNEVCS